MAAVAESLKREIAPRGRHGDVEDDVRLGLVEDGSEVAADRDAIQVEFLRARLRARRVEVDEAGQAHAFDLPQRLEPRLAHGAASDQDGLHR